MIAQRLVRKVCANCAAPYRPEPSVLRDAGLTEEDCDGAAFTRGRGCEQCRTTGFHGRLGIYELLEITPELRSMVHRRVSVEEFSRQWRLGGGRTLREEGVQLALDGKTTLEEVLSATYSHDGPASQAPQQPARREPVPVG